MCGWRSACLTACPTEIFPARKISAVGNKYGDRGVSQRRASAERRPARLQAADRWRLWADRGPQETASLVPHQPDYRFTDEVEDCECDADDERAVGICSRCHETRSDPQTHQDVGAVRLLTSRRNHADDRVAGAEANWCSGAASSFVASSETSPSDFLDSR